MNEQHCTITRPTGLNIRTGPDTGSAIVNTYDKGTILNFVAVVQGEDIQGNPLWGHSRQGHYFWLGATDRPNG